MLSDQDFTRRLLQTVATIAGTVVLLAILWAARKALLILYISALIAMGFSRLVTRIERARGVVGRRTPRWLAILVIYAVIMAVAIFIGLLVIPPLVAQGSAFRSRTSCVKVTFGHSSFERALWVR